MEPHSLYEFVLMWLGKTFIVFIVAAIIIKHTRIR
jgi:hypothetical protein